MIHLYVIDFFKLKNTHGLDTYVSQMFDPLEKRTKEIKINYIWINSPIYKGFKKEFIQGTSHFFVPGNIASNSGNPKFDFIVAEWLAGHVKEHKNIIFHFNWITHCPFAHLLKRHIHCKTILTKHCIPWRDLITDSFQVFLRLNKLFVSNESKLSITPQPLLNEQFSFSSIDHVICNTQIAKHSLIKMHDYSKEKVSIINNSIDFDFLNTQKCSKYELRCKYGFTHDEQIILFAGSINERKGAYDLLEVFDQIVENNPKIKIRLIFAGLGNHNVLLEKTVNWSKITITGTLNKEQLYNFYVMADIGVVPSYVEQFSYTAIEMMSIGLPIIVANVDGLKEVVPNGCGLKVELKLNGNQAKINREDLNKKLLHFIENKTESKTYAQRAKLHAMEHFSSKKMIEQTIDVYKKLLVRKSMVGSQPYIKDKFLVSIILFCNNTERFLDDCIKSIIGQSWKYFELIIINDNSSDNSESIIKSYNDTRVKHIKNETPKGVAYSLNIGISEAKGKYVTMIDSNFLIHQSCIEKQVEFLENQSDIALVGTWSYIIDKFKKVIGLEQYFIKDEEIKLILPFKSPFSDASVMIRTNILKSMEGYSNSYAYCENYNLWRKIVPNFKTANIPEYLTYHRIHSTNNIKEHIQKQNHNALKLQSDIMDNMGVNHSVEELLMHAKTNALHAKQFFASKEKISELERWIDKVMKHSQQNYNHPTSLINKMKEYLLYDHCQLNPSALKKEVILH